MKIKHALQRLFLDTLVNGGSHRKDIIAALVGVLSGPSRGTLWSYRVEWARQHVYIRSDNYAEYTRTYDALLRECFAIEVSDMGLLVREALGLEPLTMETELPYWPDLNDGPVTTKPEGASSDGKEEA